MNKNRILVIDDSVGVTKILKLSLELTGLYEVREEHTGRSGVEVARQFRPDLVLLDVMMPDMDGGDVARQIEADPSLKEIRIVFLTALVSKEDTAGHQLTRGGYRFLSKPISFKEVNGCVAEELSRASHCAVN